MRIARQLLPALALMVPVTTSAQARDPARELDAYVAKALKDWNVAGFAIAVVHNGRVVFAKGYGLREVGKPAPIDTQTIFAIASTTKAMTAAALGMLVDEGKIDWNDRVIEHLPGFQMADPYLTHEVTIRDLLTHRAGLPNADFLWTAGDNSRNEVVRRVRFIEPSYSLRAGYTYHNVMYTVAGEVVEAVSGMSWDDFVRTRIFEPLGMTRSVTTLAAASTRDNRAEPHWLSGDSLRVIKNSMADGIGPAGSVWSSVADMAKWVRFLLDSGRMNGQRLLQPNTWAELFRPQHIIPSGGRGSPIVRLTKPHWRTYGLGWFQQDYQGRQVDFHTGSLNGMIAMNGLIREEGLGVYMLGNTDHAELRHALMFKVFDLWLGLGNRDWSAELLAEYRADEQRSSGRGRGAGRVQNSRPTLPLEQYTGTFVDSLYGSVTVTLEEGALRFHRSQYQVGTMEHWQYDTFRVRWDDWWRGSSTITYVIGANGRADRLEIGSHTLRRK